MSFARYSIYSTPRSLFRAGKILICAKSDTKHKSYFTCILHLGWRLVLTSDFWPQSRAFTSWLIKLDSWLMVKHSSYSQNARVTLYQLTSFLEESAFLQAGSRHFMIRTWNASSFSPLRCTTYRTTQLIQLPALSLRDKSSLLKTK